MISVPKGIIYLLRMRHHALTAERNICWKQKGRLRQGRSRPCTERCHSSTWIVKYVVSSIGEDPEQLRISSGWYTPQAMHTKTHQ